MTPPSPTDDDSPDGWSTTTSVAGGDTTTDPRIRRRGLLAAASATLASLAGCSLSSPGGQQTTATSRPTGSPTPASTATPTSTPTRTASPTPTDTPTPTTAPSVDQQFVIASDALRAAVEELRSMNLIKDDVPHDVAYRYPDRYYGVNQEQVVQTVPEDVAAFEPEVVMNNVARAVQAIEKAESLVASPTEDLRRRVEVYRQTVKMFKNAGKAYRAMHASMMLFWDGLEQYQAGNYDTAYSTLRKARNAISGHESENINIPDPNPFVGQFYDAMDTLTTSDLPDGYNQNDKFIWELHWTIQASSALTTVTSELGRIFGGLEGIANMLHRYAEMKRAYAKDDWDDIQFHVRSFDGRPDTIKGTFAKDPQLRTPNVFDAYDPPGLCIGKNTEEPVAELNRAASEQHDDALEDAMRAFETAIQNCPSFPDPPANR